MQWLDCGHGKTIAFRISRLFIEHTLLWVDCMILLPRLISSVPKNGNLKFGKNAPYLTHFPETRKFQISITKLQIHQPEAGKNTNDQNRKVWRTSTEPSECFCFEFWKLGFADCLEFGIWILEFSAVGLSFRKWNILPKSVTELSRQRTRRWSFLRVMILAPVGRNLGYFSFINMGNYCLKMILSRNCDSYPIQKSPRVS